jgi:hypothetical protein
MIRIFRNWPQKRLPEFQSVFSRLTSRGEQSRARGQIWFGGELLRQQLAQDERQNAAVPVVIDLDRRIDP